MIRVLARLFRFRLALLNGVVTLGGYLLFPASIQAKPLWAAFSGVALLAAGSSALNQVMEQDLDRLMIRTRSRPIPNNDLSITTATIMGCICILAGFLLLYGIGGAQPALIGVAALAWYLALYTPLKRRTPFALAIGGVCGALPPVIGWCMAGGNPADYRVMFLAGLMYLWQIPHFWLFQRRFADDYRRAGLPFMDAASKGAGMRGIIWLWIIALIVAAMLLPAFGIIDRHLAAWYSLFPLPLIVMSLLHAETALYSFLNLFPLLVTLALAFQ
jgi:heme o synthase